MVEFRKNIPNLYRCYHQRIERFRQVTRPLEEKFDWAPDETKNVGFQLNKGINGSCIASQTLQERLNSRQVPQVVASSLNLLKFVGQIVHLVDGCVEDL